MTDEYGRKLRYKPNPEANLVLQADRSQLPRRDLEPSGEPESLYGKINPKEFGAKVQREQLTQKDIQQLNLVSNTNEDLKKQKSRKNRVNHQSILTATKDLEGIKYIPKTQQTKTTYEILLSFVEKKLGDQTQEIIKSGTDLILELLKQDNVKDLDKKTQIEQALETKLNMKEFGDLVNLSNKITDYDDNILDNKTDNVDEEVGVAVVFDDQEKNELIDNEEETDDDTEGSIVSVEDSIKANIEYEQGSVNEESVEHLKIDKTKSIRENFIPVEDIDENWLHNLLSRYYPDYTNNDINEKASEVYRILEETPDMRECENQLTEFFEYCNLDMVHKLTINKDKIYWCIKLAKAKDNPEIYQNTIQEIRNSGQTHIIKHLDKQVSESSQRHIMEVDDPSIKSKNQNPETNIKNSLDLENLAFTQGAHLMTNRKCHLPDGSFKKNKKGYEEIHIPIQKPKPIGKDETVVKIGDLPHYAQTCFHNTKALNRVQSKVFSTAFETDENILLCAPTGAGKTNVAMLTILREIGKYIDSNTNTINIQKFKIVYIAPMKALVQEMAASFAQRLNSLNIKVNELTGDRQLTKQQITETQVIVTTPEKWDVITRKQSDTSYTNLVKLIIIDEIHLLHDERGPVIESIVSRTVNSSNLGNVVRIVGLSATLPNYMDVATFIKVDPDVGLFFFDNTYRPCPLKQKYIGINEKKAIKRFQLMNEITYEEAVNEAGKNQVLIFVHSRKETSRTAKSLIDMAIEKETIGLFIGQTTSKSILEKAANTNIRDTKLREILPFGFAIHHAGLSRNDRSNVEELFSQGHIQVLVSTATLAWGVNLPAHTVIIKGTQVYSPEKGTWCELSPQDVLQMLGRAGRPQFDNYGEGIIITSSTELQYYLSLLNQQLPIESQLISKLTDIVNAEIVLGNIRNLDEGVEWLRNTYLFIRMIKNGASYGVSNEEIKTDSTLRQRRVDLMHSALTLLDDSQLIKYEQLSGKIQPTEIGRIASYYYITFKSINTYNKQLKPHMEMIELFRVFTLSEEFKHIPVREEEKAEISKLIERVPIPIKESVEDKSSKINLLLQAYISQLKLEGFALIADMVYITQSAVRILRAMFEISLRRNWASLSHNLLDFCKIVEKRSWLSMSPLRLFNSMPLDLIKKIEKKDFPWDRFYDLNPEEIGELVGIPKAGKLIYKYVHHFPKLDLQAVIQPITRSLLKLELTITPDFDWDDKIHGTGEEFRVYVEDVNREVLLYQDVFLLKKKYIKEDHYISFTIPLFEPLSPCYFVSLISDRWLHSITTLPISFKNLILPEKNYPHTELYDMQPLPTTCFDVEEFNKLYENWVPFFNQIQTQVFNTLYSTDENAVVCAPPGSGKTICAEFAILRLFSSFEDGVKCRCLYLAPRPEMIETCYRNWQMKFKKLNRIVVKLTGEINIDLNLLSEGDIILSTPEQWDVLSRRWKQRTLVQQINLIIADEMHLISGQYGPTYEIVLSRMRYIASSSSSQAENMMRFVALSVPLANCKNIAHWLGASSEHVFNFSNADRIVPLELYFQTFTIPHYPSMILAMQKPVYLAIKQQAETKPVIVFVSDARQCRTTAVNLISDELNNTQQQSSQFLLSEIKGYDITTNLQDVILKQTLSQGVGYYHETLTDYEKETVIELFINGVFQVLVASRESCYALSEVTAYMTIIMGTSYYEGREHRYIDYPMAEILQMMGRSGRQSEDEYGKCILMTKHNQKEYYKKFSSEGLPIESHLDQFLHDHFNAEIATKTIENKQDAVDYLTWTFMYRRMSKNPNYYNLQGVSHRHLSDHLSELVETTVKHLADSKCISIEEDMDLFPLNLGMICAYYNVNYATMEIFSQSITSKTKLRGLLEIVSSSTEFESIPIRHKEDIVLSKITDSLNLSFSTSRENMFYQSNIKTNILLQAHFSRFKLPQDLLLDQTNILHKIMPLLYTSVDVISSNGWFGPAIVAMELCQMSVQAQWDRDSTLKQIPHFDNALIEKAKKMQVTLVSDIKEMEDEQRNELLKDLSVDQIRDIANFVNKFPIVDMEFKLLTSSEECFTNCNLVLEVSLIREVDEDDEEVDTKVEAPFYPKEKHEGWWIVVGEPKSNVLLGIKKLSFKQKANIKLQFVAPANPGNHNLKVLLVSDSYLGCDQEYDLDMEIIKGNSSEEEEEGETEDDGNND